MGLLTTFIFLDGEAKSLCGDDTLFFFIGDVDSVFERPPGLIRIILGEAFFGGDITLFFVVANLLDVYQSFFVGDTTGFLGEVLLFLVGDPKRPVGLLDVVFFFLAGDLEGDFLRGSVAVLMAVNWDTMGAPGKGI